MKAADLIPEIRKAGAALMKAEIEGFGQTLFLAIELGTLLNQAKANPDAGTHGKWEEWLLKQQFDFSIRKAQRCMRYANKKKELEAAAKTSRLSLLAYEHRLSICDADALLRKPRKASRSPKPKAELEPPEPKPRSSDPEVVLGEIDADEVASIVGETWDREKQDQLLLQQLKPLPPTRVFDLLVEACLSIVKVELLALFLHLQEEAWLPDQVGKACAAG
jgi:hypothetical protein